MKKLIQCFTHCGSFEPSIFSVSSRRSRRKLPMHVWSDHFCFCMDWVKEIGGVSRLHYLWHLLWPHAQVTRSSPPSLPYPDPCESINQDVTSADQVSSIPPQSCYHKLWESPAFPCSAPPPIPRPRSSVQTNRLSALPRPVRQLRLKVWSDFQEVSLPMCTHPFPQPTIVSASPHLTCTVSSSCAGLILPIPLYSCLPHSLFDFNSNVLFFFISNHSKAVIICHYLKRGAVIWRLNVFIPGVSKLYVRVFKYTVLGIGKINFIREYFNLYLSLGYIQFAEGFNLPLRDHRCTYIFESSGITHHLLTLIPCWDGLTLEIILSLTWRFGSFMYVQFIT